MCNNGKNISTSFWLSLLYVFAGAVLYFAVLFAMWEIAHLIVWVRRHG